MTEEILKQTKEKMQNSIEFFKNELKTIRTGRASSSLVEKIGVDYYGVKTPLIQVAAISIPDPRTILIQPWDKNLLPEIEKAITNSELGITPTNDGNSVILNLPSLTEESKENFIKLLKDQEEKAKIALRNIRHESFDLIKKQEKEGIISEDELYRAKEELDKIVKNFEEEVEKLTKNKEAEIREV